MPEGKLCNSCKEISKSNVKIDCNVVEEGKRNSGVMNSSGVAAVVAACSGVCVVALMSARVVFARV